MSKQFQYDLRVRIPKPARLRLIANLTVISLCFGAAAFAADSVQPAKYIRVGVLPPGWQFPLLTYGDRLQKPGKERLSITGTVTRGGKAVTQFQAIHELPNSIRFQELAGPSLSAIVFDGNRFGKSDNNVQKDDSDLVEMLSYDSPAGFIYAAVNGLPYRKLGSRFRMDGQHGTPFSGPSYDIYLIRVPVQQPGKIKQQAKFFHVNSDTQLIERINYQDADNPRTKVEIVLGNWATVSNNRVPQLITRVENGVEVLRLNITSSVFSPTMLDDAFQKP